MPALVEYHQLRPRNSIAESLSAAHRNECVLASPDHQRGRVDRFKLVILKLRLCKTRQRTLDRIPVIVTQVAGEYLQHKVVGHHFFVIEERFEQSSRTRQ